MPSERQELDKNNPWWGEHVHRYEYTIEKYINNNARVLDIACGTGFGTELIAKSSSNEIIGGDISDEAIEFCSKNLSGSNLKFQQMDGTQLPFEDNYFDVITSFETIEHTTEFDQMIKEFKRTTKQGGLIVLSTPNFVINSPSGVVTNPFHTQEWDYEGFVRLLDTHFKDYTLFGQQYIRYSKKSIAYAFETLLLKRGFRKTPLSLQNKIMKIAGAEGIYPTEKEYAFVGNKEEILKCKTFYVVCKNR